MKYSWWKRGRCPHSSLEGIYGDMINAVGSRLYCHDCGKFLDGPVLLARAREREHWAYRILDER